jgi:8-oxo-dGTP pyrophosphatase MutT (NUDIX family)
MYANPDLVYGSIMISPLNKVLIIQGRCTGKWSFPKGHSNDNETQLDCAIRETYEETGIQLSNRFQKIIHLSKGIYFLYYCEEENPAPKDVNEVMETAWVPIEKLCSMNVNVDISMFLRKYSYLYVKPAQRILTSKYIRGK